MEEDQIRVVPHQSWHDETIAHDRPPGQLMLDKGARQDRAILPVADRRGFSPIQTYNEIQSLFLD